MIAPPATRAGLGFVAAATSVLVFHQGVVSILHSLGLSPLGPYRTVLVPPFWVPAIVSLCFWGGVWGALFGAVAWRLPVPLWVGGMAIGLLAMLVGWFIVAPIKHLPMAAGYAAWPMARSLLVTGALLGLDVRIAAPRELWPPDEVVGMAQDLAAESVRESDELSWKKWSKRLNEYLQMLEALFSPDLFVIGGGVSKKSGKFIPRLELQAEVVPAELLNEAGIVGAALAHAVNSPATHTD